MSMRCLWEHLSRNVQEAARYADLGLRTKSGLEAHNGKINIMRYLGHESR